MGILKRASQTLGIGQRVPRRRRLGRAVLFCEPLEHRRLLSSEATATSLSQITAQTNFDVITAVSTDPTGLTPQDIRNAYGIDLISFSGGTVSGTGAGETIAIVDAFNDPNIASDLANFDEEFGISAPPSFTIDNLGATTTDAGWALETSLDVEWAHAIAPLANIILVEAASSSLSSLFSAVSFAGKQAGVTVVSMSWGSSEFRSESSYDSVFSTAAGHAAVTYIAASGDTGASGGPEYPSVSPNVLAVGGTTLSLTASGSYGAESGWSGSTGGFSGTDTNFRSDESEPSYQTSTLESVGLSEGVRTTPDVSFDANPDSGVSVYDSVGYDGQSGWFQVGGTSMAAPAWAGLIAIVDQGLATGGKGSLSTTEVLTDLYSLPSSDFNDITTGSNGYNATVGYDLVTGLGTPRSNLLVAGVLAANGVSESSTTATAPATPTATTTSTSQSPHKTKAKHTRVVVKKHRKAAPKAGVGSAGSAGTIKTSESPTRSPIAESTSSSAGSSSTPTASLVSTELAAVPSQISTIALAAGDAHEVSSADASGDSNLQPNQSLTSDQERSNHSAIREDRETLGSSDRKVNSQTVLAPMEKSPMSRPTFVSYEPVLLQLPALPAEAFVNPAHEEFDAALAQFVAVYLERHNNAIRRASAIQHESRESSSRSAISTVVGTGAIAAAAYRFVLQPPDDPKLRPSWYSRFPTR